MKLYTSGVHLLLLGILLTFSTLSALPMQITVNREWIRGRHTGSRTGSGGDGSMTVETPIENKNNEESVERVQPPVWKSKQEAVVMTALAYKELMRRCREESFGPVATSIYRCMCRYTGKC